MSPDTMSMKVYFCAGLVAWLVFFSTGADAALRYTGVNLSGAEFGQAIPGTYNVDYIYPNQAEVDYFQRRGMNSSACRSAGNVSNAPPTPPSTPPSSIACTASSAPPRRKACSS